MTYEIPKIIEELYLVTKMLDVISTHKGELFDTEFEKLIIRRKELVLLLITSMGLDKTTKYEQMSHQTKKTKIGSEPMEKETHH